jgi:flagellar assembly protein FliH
LSNIIKPFSIVDNTSGPVDSSAVFELELVKRPVIKRNYFNYSKNPYADETLLMPRKDGYLDEINRLKVEIAEARAELRSLNRLLDEDIPEGADIDEAELNLKKAHQARAEAEQLLEEAKRQAGELLKEAQAEGRRITEEAKSGGYLEGFDNGFAQAQNEFITENNPKLMQLADLLEAVSGYQEEMIAENERQLTELVITVCEKIIGRELESEPRTVVTMLYRVLDENRREEDIRITLSPELVPAEAKAAADLRKLITQIAPGAMLVINKEAPPGTAVVDASRGITDLSVKTQLENIKEMLTR